MECVGKKGRYGKEMEVTKAQFYTCSQT